MNLNIIITNAGEGEGTLFTFICNAHNNEDREAFRDLIMAMAELDDRMSNPSCGLYSVEATSESTWAATRQRIAHYDFSGGPDNVFLTGLSIGKDQIEVDIRFDMTISELASDFGQEMEFIEWQNKERALRCASYS